MTEPHPQRSHPSPSAMTGRFPVMALAASGVLLLTIAVGAQPGDQGTRFPLLALLGLCELGVIINVAGAYLAFRAARARTFTLSTLWPLTASVLATGVFLWLGIQLWPL